MLWDREGVAKEELLATCTLPDMQLAVSSFLWPCSPIIIDHVVDYGLHILLYIFLVPND